MEYITIDVSFLESIGFDFDFVFFKKIDTSMHVFVISEITDKEIRKHLKKWIIPFAEGLKKITPLKNKQKYKEIKNLKPEKDIIDVYEEFLKRVNAVIIPVSNADPEKVFKDYFNRSGTFKNTGKKDEFPDAFAISSLLEYTGNQNLIILSCDNDWANAVNEIDRVTLYKNRFDAVVGFCKEDAATEMVNKYFEKKTGVVSIIEDEFFIEAAKQKYYDEESELDDSNSEINVDIDSIEIAGIEINDKRIEAYISFNYSFSLSFMFDNYDEVCYDKEDGMMFNIFPTDALVEGKETGWIHISFEIIKESLRIKNHSVLDADYCFWESSNSYEITETQHEPVDRVW